MDFRQITIAGVDGKGGLNRWEGRIPFLYLDSRKVDGKPAPLVTVGVGCALQQLEALTLPFAIDGRLATMSEIAFDFATLQSAPFGFAAAHYAQYTRCRLLDPAIDALVEKRFAVFIAALQKMFPGFDGFPDTVKAGCLDLIYGLGVDGLSLPHYPSFHKAVIARDWKLAALQCGSDTNIQAYAERNKARAALFLEAS
jgi:hypothetical protein